MPLSGSWHAALSGLRLSGFRGWWYGTRHSLRYILILDSMACDTEQEIRRRGHFWLQLPPVAQGLCTRTAPLRPST